MSNYPGLRACQGDPEALKAFIRAEQKKRDDKAEKEWEGYRLVRKGNDRYWSEIETPRGDRYRCVVTTEGVKRFIGDKCLDQRFCDDVNEAARQAGIELRLETKHAEIAHRRERETAESRMASRDRQPSIPPKLPSANEFRTAPANPVRSVVGATEQGGR